MRADLHAGLALLLGGVLGACVPPESEPEPFSGYGYDYQAPDDDDDDDAVGDDDDAPLGPAGSVVGFLVDASSGNPVQGVVDELGAEGLNAVETDAAGYFVLLPEVFAASETTQFWAYQAAGDYVDSFVALTEDAYLETGHGLEVDLWPSSTWAQSHQEWFGSPWDPGLGLLVFDLDFEDLEDVEGAAVWIDAPHDQAFVYDAAGELVAGSEIPFDSTRARVILTGVAPAPANVEVLPRGGVECLGPSSLDTLDNGVVHAYYSCRPER